FRVSRNELLALADGKASQVHSIAYGTADGMRSKECNGANPPAWRDRQGMLWFPTIKGVVRIDPQHLKGSADPPPVLVESFIADRATRSSGVRLPPDISNYEFHYTALSFFDPDRVLFKYRLEGFDKQWIDAGTRRIAYYTNIPAGRYSFHVIACNSDGVWNNRGAIV